LTASGFSSSSPIRRTKALRIPLLEFGSPTEPCRVVLRPSISPLLRTGPLARTRPFQGLHGSASPEVLAPLSTTTSGSPWSPIRPLPAVPECGGLPRPRRCRPQGSCPSRRFRPRHGTARTLASPPTPCRTRRLAALFHAARARMELPFRAFPSRGAVPALAGPCFLASSLSDLRQRGMTEDFTAAFPVEPALCLGSPPESEPRRMDRDDGYPATASSAPSDPPVKVCPRKPPASTTPGSPVSGRHARFEALLPPGVRSLSDPTLAGVKPAAPVLSWAFSPLEFPPTRPRVRFPAPAHAFEVASPVPMHSSRALPVPPRIAVPELRCLGS